MKIKVLLFIFICLQTFACTANESLFSEREEVLEQAALLIQEGDFNKAYGLLISGAEQNDHEMQHAIALIVSNGYGPVEKSERNQQALKWIVLSAQGGFEDSINWLADSYQNGWFGLEEDRAAADCWRNKIIGKEPNTYACPFPE